MSRLSMPSEKPLWIRRRRGPSGEVWFIFNVHAEPISTTLPADPTCVWEGDAKWIDGRTLTLPANETWVAQMPRVEN